MYKGRAQDKLDDAAKAEKAAADMKVELERRIELNEQSEIERQAAAFKAHKAHVLHVREHYAKLEADQAKEIADAHAAWSAKYNSQKRLPLGTPAETWTANMPDHVIEDGDFHVKAPAPIEKVMADQAAAEKKAEEKANPPKKEEKKAAAEAAAEEPEAAFLQLYRRRGRSLAQKHDNQASESSESSESSGSSSSSDSSSD